MTGWDTPSRPTWDPQDGPEDSTQAFPAPDNSGADDRRPQPAGSGWDGSGSTDALDFDRSDFGAPDFGGGTAAGSDLGGADLGSGDYGRGDYRAVGFPPEPSGFHQEPSGFPHEQNGFDRGGASSTPPSEFLTQEFEQRKPGATLSGRGGYGSGPQVSARDEPPWPGPSRQESARLDSGRQESARPEYGRPGEYGRPDLGRADLDRQGGSGQDFPRRDPGRADYSAAYSTYSGQPEQAEQAPTAVNHADADLAARMDPALQDFFSPAKPDHRYGSARPGQAALPPGLPDRDQPGPGQPGPGRPVPGWSDSEQQSPRRGDERGPQRPGRPADPWQDQDGYPSPGPRAGQRPPGPRAARRVEDEILPASRGKRILAIGAVVAIVAAGGAYLAVHKTSGGNNNAVGGLAPTASTVTSAPASTATAKPKSKNATKKSGENGSATSSGGFVLSTPATAGGYPLGTDPHFLATATATVATIEQSAINGGGGTITGSPVSASYTLPAEQTIEFVGYQGTFNPKTVMANLGSFGSGEQTYSPGKNGGQLACANTTATSTAPSGAVCVWVTKSTLGFTEFFTQADGPEALTTAMNKGAQDTISLRSGVETVKS